MPAYTGPGQPLQTLDSGAGGPLVGLMVGLGRSVMGVESWGMNWKGMGSGRAPQGSELQAGELGLERLEAQMFSELFLKGSQGP